MGIIRRKDDVKPLRVEDSIEGFPHVVESESEGELRERADSLEAMTQFLSRRRRREERAARKERQASEDKHPKAVGLKKWRRQEHVKSMMSYFDSEELRIDNPNEVFNNELSALGLLFECEENMKIWEQFLNLSEDEQQAILDHGIRARKLAKSRYRASSSGDEWCILEEPEAEEEASSGIPTNSKDLRQCHPAAYSSPSPRDCYENIDNHLKKLFRQRDLPWDFVMDTEQELRNLYTSDAAAVWLAVHESSLFRMLIHATVQYLKLKSKSVTDGDTGTRLTEVSNPSGVFAPPDVGLVTFLQKYRNIKIYRDEEEGVAFPLN